MFGKDIASVFARAMQEEERTHFEVTAAGPREFLHGDKTWQEILTLRRTSRLVVNTFYDPDEFADYLVHLQASMTLGLWNSRCRVFGLRAGQPGVVVVHLVPRGEADARLVAVNHFHMHGASPAELHDAAARLEEMRYWVYPKFRMPRGLDVLYHAMVTKALDDLFA